MRVYDFKFGQNGGGDLYHEAEHGGGCSYFFAQIFEDRPQDRKHLPPYIATLLVRATVIRKIEPDGTICFAADIRDVTPERSSTHPGFRLPEPKETALGFISFSGDSGRPVRMWLVFKDPEELDESASPHDEIFGN